MSGQQRVSCGLTGRGIPGTDDQRSDDSCELFIAVLSAFQTKSGSSPKAPSSALISSSLGRWVNRSAASITFGRI
jgi:hypothetical protein